MVLDWCIFHRIYRPDKASAKIIILQKIYNTVLKMLQLFSVSLIFILHVPRVHFAEIYIYGYQKFFYDVCACFSRGYSLNVWCSHVQMQQLIMLTYVMFLWLISSIQCRILLRIPRMGTLPFWWTLHFGKIHDYTAYLNKNNNFLNISEIYYLKSYKNIE